jgi:hypothetical protein
MNTTIQAQSYNQKSDSGREFWNLIIDSMTPKRISAILSIVLFYALLTVVVSFS